MRSHRALLLFALAAGCAEGRTTRTPDAPPPDDAADDIAADVASDLPGDLLDFDGPRFDVPPAPDAAPDVTPDAGPDVAPDAAPDAVPDVARRVDHCYLIDQRALDAAPGAAAGPVRVAVFVAGATPGAGRGADVTVELGAGPGAQDPLDATGAWRWAGASYDRDVDGRGATGARDYDEYTASLTAPTAPDEYAFAARARVGMGPWTACDFNPAMGRPYAAAWAGRLTVAAASAARVGYCNLQFPRALSLASGATSAMNAYGRVFADRLSNRGCADMPTAAELGAQWGYGPAGSWPSTAGWTWLDGRYNAHRDSTNPLIEGNCANLEYQATPRAPTDCAPRAFGWRFRVGAGPWTYCRWAPPAEGAPTTPAFNVWDPTLAGAMTVTGCP
ncbi:MAG: hypothetical protein U0324_06085 [Polyangiales bacterium]